MTLPLVKPIWESCRTFVREECASRADSHGLPHMEEVTQLALLIASLEGIRDPTQLQRIVAVAMLHDVADHKYDEDGHLEDRVRSFLRQLFRNTDNEADAAWQAIDAVSFSKEKKRGSRWFVPLLGESWTVVRDVVSDADKLLAIGKFGLARCWDYQIELHEHNEKQGEPVAPLTPESLTHYVVFHAHEKLLILADEYITTGTGKFLAAPKQLEMTNIISRWETNPPKTMTFSAD